MTNVNREYFVAQQEAKMAKDGGLSNHGKSISAAKEFLKKMAKSEPYVKSNSICAFFKQGKCQRGSECPFKHESDDKSVLESQDTLPTSIYLSGLDR